MRLISQIFCLFAMCCQLLAATGFVYHTHECSESGHHPVSNENVVDTQYSQVENSCCGLTHHSNEGELELSDSDFEQTLQHVPHNHPCHCQLHTQANRVAVEVNTGSSRSKTITYYLPAHSDSHRYQSQNPSQAPPQKFLYAPPPPGSSGVALMYIHCVYLI